jgi:hypothetical protein
LAFFCFWSGKAVAREPKDGKLLVKTHGYNQMNRRCGEASDGRQEFTCPLALVESLDLTPAGASAASPADQFTYR